MKNIKLIVAFGTLIATSYNSNAQSEVSALENSQTQGVTTARGLGLGGAMGAVGADFSATAINPAGLGLYRSSEFLITPEFQLQSNQAKYLANNLTKTDNRFIFNNFGIVLNKTARGGNYEKSDWKSYSFAFGLNRIADFNSYTEYQGVNSYSSITDLFAEDAKNYGIEQGLVPPYGYLAYHSYLLDNNYNSNVRKNILDKGGSVLQNRGVKSEGGINEWNISFGANYKEKLMLGLSVGIVNYRLDRSNIFNEIDNTNNPNNDFDYLSYGDYYSSRGTGINLKLGAIVMPNDYFRLGLAFHTPTWTSFSDLSDFDIITNTENYKDRLGEQDRNPQTNVQPEAPYTFDYDLRTPWKASLSGMVFLGKYGFISADYELIGYNSMRYSFANGYQDLENSINNAISDTYKPGHVLRVGVEGKWDLFMARLGYAYQTSPYNRSEDFGGDRMDFSAGLGVRLPIKNMGTFFIDAAYVYSQYAYNDFSYYLRTYNVGMVDYTNVRNRVILTLGYKF